LDELVGEAFDIYQALAKVAASLHSSGDPTA
jgi:hypothetical protein